VENKGFFDYSKLGDSGIKPRSFALSEFHFLLLIRDKIKVYFFNCIALHHSL
jgi:vacuolar protein sorting-associated protein 18